MTYFDLTLSIVLYKTPSVGLKPLIKTVLSSKYKIHLFLIDNSPNDDLKNLIIDDRVSYIYNNANLGYGAGHNIALRKAINSSKYHIILNPDIELNELVIEKLYDFMENNHDIGHVMPKIYYPDGQVQYVCKLLPTPFDLVFKRFLPNNVFETHFDRFQLKFTGYNKIMDVPYLSGCFMFLRCSSLKEIGLFNERFFMYPEDVDITRRMHKKFRTVFYPEVSIIHKHEAGSYKSPTLLWIHIINMIRYFNKWGWFFDKERELINKQILSQLSVSTKD